MLTSHVAGPTSKRSKSIRVPPKISIGDVTSNNIGTLRKLNSVLFPVAYSDRYYKEVLAPEVEEYCKLAYYNDIPVGAITCRIEKNPSSASTSSSEQPTGKLYLMTLGVLAPYRRQGLASKLLSHVVAKATEASLAASLTPAPSAAAVAAPAASQQAKGKGKAVDTGKSAAPEPSASSAPAPASHPILESIFVHVQTNNEDSRTFWLGQGFEETETIKDYYKPDIEGPRDAWLLQRAIQI